jgi:hypothetical protein
VGRKEEQDKKKDSRQRHPFGYAPFGLAPFGLAQGRQGRQGRLSCAEAARRICIWIAGPEKRMRAAS